MQKEITDFIELVSKMRHVQKEYFRLRSPYLLKESKQLEKQVDMKLEKLKPLLPEEKTLFEE